MSASGFSQIAARLFAESAEDRVRAAEAGVAGFGAFLNERDQIRVFVEATKNLGHQSSSIRVMTRLITTFNYAGRITVIYQVGNEGVGYTAEKLGLLLPNFDPARIEEDGYHIQVATNPNVYFHRFDRMGDQDDIDLGFTGGADLFDVENIAAALKVRYFLRLQPYLWTYPDEIQFGVGEREAINLATDQTLGESFKRRAYWMPPPAVDAPTWTWFKDHGPEDRRRRVARAHTLVQQVAGTAIRVCPMYGVKVRGQTGRPPEQIITQYIASIAQAIAEVEEHVPAVIVDFDEPSTTVLNRMGRLLDGEYTAEEDGIASDYAQYDRDIYEAELFITDPVRQRAEIERLQGLMDNASLRLERIRDRTSFLRENRFRDMVDVVTSDQPEDVLIEKIRKLRDAGDGILVFQLGPVPPLIYDYIFSLGRFPSTFEGQATASLAINLGLPYLQMKHVHGHPLAMRYPSVDLAADAPSEIALECQFAANALTQGFDLNLEDAFTTKTGITALFALNGYLSDERPDLREYFTTIRAFYQQSYNDKLLLALVFLNYIVRGGVMQMPHVLHEPTMVASTASAGRTSGHARAGRGRP